MKMRRRACRIACAAAVLMVVAAGLWAELFQIDHPQPYGQFGDCSVARVVCVVDGDTFDVVLENGQEARVRLIGVDAPESKHPDATRNTREGADSTAFMEAMLPSGSTVWLQRDVSDVDKHGRLLRYVWLSDPEQEGTTLDRDLLNALLVESGNATPLAIPPDVRHMAALNNIEKGGC